MRSRITTDRVSRFPDLRWPHPRTWMQLCLHRAWTDGFVNRNAVTRRILLWFWLFAMCTPASAQPRVVQTFPENGATAVDPATDELRVVFDQPMGVGIKLVVEGLEGLRREIREEMLSFDMRPQYDIVVEDGFSYQRLREDKEYLHPSVLEGVKKGGGYEQSVRGYWNQIGVESGDGMVDFADFLLFVQQYGLSRGDERYDVRYDLDRDGTIGFGDF